MRSIRYTTGVLPADCPEDGGKWAIYCIHFAGPNNIIGQSVLQDTNKQRLAPWRKGHPGHNAHVSKVINEIASESEAGK